MLDEYRRTEPTLQIVYEGEAIALLPPSLEAPTYRFIQEALHNIRKHAQATRATVRIRVLAGLLLIEVSDNGRGFDLGQVMNRQATGTGYSFGLRTMRNRIQQAGGSWEIQSKQGVGTTVKARFRLATHPAALTNREREVLRLVADGLPTKQISISLSITERTVKFHVNSILRKLGADNRAQAVALAAQRGLL